MIGWLKGLFTRSTLLDYEWWRQIGIDGTTVAGVNVNARTALHVPAYWRAINLVAGDVAKMPLQVIQKNADGSREVDENHPANEIITYQVNEHLSAFQWKLAGVAHAMNDGGWFSAIRRGPSGRVLGLDLLEPKNVNIDIDEATGRPIYTVLAQDGTVPVTLTDDQVLHITGLTCDGHLGYSLHSVGRDALALTSAAQKFTGSFFGNSARPGVVLEHPGKLSPKAKQNIVQSWKAQYEGPDKQFKTGVLEEGMQARTLTISPNDAQMNETLESGVRDSSNLTGVPGHKLGGMQNTSYSSLEQENQAYLNQVLDFWLCNIEQALTRLFFGRLERRRRMIRFDRSALLQASIADRAAAHNAAIQGGWMTPNEIRRLENLPPIEGGDVLISMHAGKLEEDDDDGSVDDEGSGHSSGDEGEQPESEDRGLRGGMVRRNGTHRVPTG